MENYIAAQVAELTPEQKENRPRSAGCKNSI